MRHQPIDEFAGHLAPDKRAAVYRGAKGGHEKRTQVLFDHYRDPDQLRRLAGAIRQHAI